MNSFLLVFTVILSIHYVESLREFNIYNNATYCSKVQQPFYPFAYTKYLNHKLETKSRTNTNLQDFRHSCQTRGGLSKCHVCKTITDSTTNYTYYIQLQGVNTNSMSINIPTVTDTAWSVGGQYRYDYGAAKSHYCVFLSGGACIEPNTTDYTNCKVRCFGYGNTKPAISAAASTRSKLHEVTPALVYTADPYLEEVNIWSYPNNCSELYTSQGLNCTYTNTPGVNSHITTPSHNPQVCTYYTPYMYTLCHITTLYLFIHAHHMYNFLT